jgi:predicted transposase YdaD
MLAENLQHWAEREREEGREEGRQEANRETALQLISIGLLKDSQIAQVTGLNLAQIEALRPQPPS